MSKPTGIPVGFRRFREASVFGLAALVCFIVGFIFHGAGTVTSTWFDPTAMMLAGLAFGTLHLMGYGAAWPLRR